MVTTGKHHRLRPGYYNTPTLLQIFRDNWLNALTETSCFIAAVLLWKLCPPAITHYFPYFEGVETSPLGIRYSQPLRPEYVDTVEMALISFCVPITVMLVMNLWVLRDYYNWDAAFTGLSYALSTSTLFTCIIKVLIGGLRPNFYEQCRPAVYLDALVASSSTTASQQSLVQYGTVEQLCTNTDKFSLYEVQKSFPSGHASSAFAGFVFLTLWLSAHFKTLGRPHENTTKKPQGPSVATTATTTTTIISLNEALHDPEKATAPPKPLSDQHFGAVPHWKLVLFAAPLCVATALSLSKVRDGWHHPVDVVCGAGIGTFFAVVAYKMVFWSVWDAKDNHVPRRSGVRGES